MATYYAVCNVNGPISVELAGETETDALTAFAAMDSHEAVDGCKTDMEDALDIDGSDMGEDEFEAAAKAAGARWVRSMQTGGSTDGHISGGWAIWRVE